TTPFRFRNLKRHIFTRWQDSVFVEQHSGNPYADQGNHKQTDRQNTIFFFYTFVFSAGRQQVDQFDIGYRPHIEKHYDKEDDRKAKYSLSKCSGRKYDLKFIQLKRKEL